MRPNVRGTTFTVFLLYTTTISSIVESSYGLAVQVALLGALLMLYLLNSRPLQLDSLIATPLIGFVLFVLVVSISNQSFFPVARVVLFCGATLCLFLIVPSQVPKSSVVHGIILVAVLTTVVEALVRPLIEIGGALVVLNGNIVIEPLGFFLIGNSNGFGILAALGLVGAVSVWLRTEDSVMFLSAIVCVVGVVFSLSRGALLVALSGCLTVVLARWRARFGIISGIIISLSGGIALTFVGFFPDIIGVDLSRRQILWPSSLKTIAERPLLGHGYVDTAAAISSYAPSTAQGLSPHHFLFQIAVISGAVGTALYVLFLLRALVAVIQDSCDNPIAVTNAGMIVAIVSAGFFGSITVLGINTVSVLAALTVALTQRTHTGSVQRGRELT